MATPIYGIMGEFESPEKLLSAVRLARGAGYRDMDAYSPFPVDGLAEALEYPPSRLPVLVFFAALAGCAAGYSMCLYLSKYDYPLNIGGRPFNSWPAFIPITFELTILFAAVAAVVGMLALNKLPRPYHPVFNVPEFERASQDRFFLCLDATNPDFERPRTHQFMLSAGALSVSEVEY